jgi:hypothetical protein
VLTLRLNAIMSTDILFNVKKTKLIGLNFWWLLKILSYNCVGKKEEGGVPNKNELFHNKKYKQMVKLYY